VAIPILGQLLLDRMGFHLTIDKDQQLVVSYYYDKETGFYYLTTRYYDPEVGRFISADDPRYLDFTMAYGHNRYAYCINNPVMGYDPEG